MNDTPTTVTFDLADPASEVHAEQEIEHGVGTITRVYRINADRSLFLVGITFEPWNQRDGFQQWRIQ
jgi:hypothetical protein